MNHGNQHSIRNLNLGSQRYGTFRRETAYPNGDFANTYSGWPSRMTSGAMLPTGYLESPRYRTNNSSQTWSNFSTDSSGGKIVNGLMLGFIIGVGMYGVSMLTDKLMPSK
tara:strand:+ start:2021 stop:2350 length:330 start_codon:yes stop_codon:yes gene_type:complete